MTKKVILIILDGWGIGNGSKSDAISNAKIPVFKQLIANYPHATLNTSGLDVGLPEGQMGNSEVGHLNIGAGRVVYQELAKINKAIDEKTLDHNKEFLEAIAYAKSKNKNLHLMGLVSDGGVHSHINHIKALCNIIKDQGFDHNKLFIHAFADGRDTDPKSGIHFINELKKHLLITGGRIASVVGRYYAMDRDKRWERVKVAYDLLTEGKGLATKDISDAINNSYKDGVTDEFIKPIVQIDNSGNPVGVIQENDTVICFNFRTDRCREITEVLTQKNMPEFAMKKMNLHYVTMTNYDDSFKNVRVIYDKDNLTNTLGEVIAEAGKKQIRIAETEKYPHVTFFFSGGREKEFEGESRIMVPSPKVATYDLQPEMSAEQVSDKICSELEKEDADFVCLNFANPDMVGHTGVYDAVIKAVEKVDACTGRVVHTAVNHGYSVIIIADHGNADYLINEDGTPNTAHTTNPVPCIIIDKDIKSVKSGRLADIAPTVIKLMGLKKPMEMDGLELI